MIHLDDIYSLTEFQRHTKEHIERLKQTGRPEVLTVNGFLPTFGDVTLWNIS